MKLKAADNLVPIRNKMMDLIKPNTRVIEFGCGNRDLLFNLSPQIKYGLGIDKSKDLINYTIKEREKKNISNVEFLCEELGNNYKHSERYDCSIASLFFHVIPMSDAVYLLNKMRTLSDTMLICGFSRPETQQQKFLSWLDQRFSSHYRNFKKYQKYGYMEGVLSETQCSTIATCDTSISFLKIYKIS